MTNAQQIVTDAANKFATIRAAKAQMVSKWTLDQVAAEMRRLGVSHPETLISRLAKDQMAADEFNRTHKLAVDLVVGDVINHTVFAGLKYTVIGAAQRIHPISDVAFIVESSSGKFEKVVRTADTYIKLA